MPVLRAPRSAAHVVRLALPPVVCRVRNSMALLMLLLAAACTERGQPVTPPLASPSTATTSASSDTNPSGSVRVLPPGTASATFRTPSDNSTCRVTPAEAACTPKEHSWGVYDQDDSGCTEPVPRAVLVRVADTVRVTSGCDAVVAPTAEVLPYGSGIELGDIRCVSERRAVSCARTDTGAGFTLSKAMVDTNPSAAARGDAPRPPSTVTLPPEEYGQGFVSPTGDIICDIYGTTGMTCFVYGGSLTYPEYDEKREGPCDADFSGEVHFDGKSPGTTATTCRSDALGGGPVLGYGHTLNVGQFSCTSATTGVTCRSTRTGHGFEVNKTRLRGF